MNNKFKKIVDLGFDGATFYADIRIEIPKKRITPEFIKDLMDNKDKIINGEIIIGQPSNYIETRLLVDNIDG